jgi:hypothetical protein
LCFGQIKWHDAIANSLNPLLGEKLFDDQIRVQIMVAYQVSYSKSSLAKRALYLKVSFQDGAVRKSVVDHGLVLCKSVKYLA